jgi:hypothetical protein
MKLLCALMVGTQCLAWHPKGTKKSDIGEVGTFLIVCEPKIEGARVTDKCAEPVSRSIRIPISTMPCHRVEWGAADKKPLKNFPVGTEGYYSCTKQEQAKWAAFVRRSEMNPLELQHEDAQ